MNRNEARERIVKRIAREFKDGDVVNLGIGLPTMVANHLPEGVEIMLHSENGLTGLGPSPMPGMEDKDIINAGNQPATILPGGAYFDSALSFGIIRGGHLDATVLGTLEVDREGNIANYIIPGQMVAGMGGAMDLCTGARRVIVATDHVTKKGKPKILNSCTLPLTAMHQVNMIVTELAVIEVVSTGLLLREKAPEVSIEYIQSVTEPELILPAEVKNMDEQ